jgi:type IV secretory pathway VirB10-like protein
MAEKKEPEFTVTDRRRFLSEDETPPANQAAETAQVEAPPEPPSAAQPPQPEQPMPPPPTTEERQAQHEAFKESSHKLDEQIESRLGGRSAKDFEMSFERFIASLYMTALMQLGLMHEQGGPPQVDLIGARQTIDTIGLLADKTKGNLTAAEETLVQNCLYELRMAYVDVTNALTRPQPPGAVK